MGRPDVKVTIDTNILVRAVVQDDVEQGRLASALLREAEEIVVPTPCLCEFVWVIARVYGIGRADIAAALRALLAAGNVTLNRPAAEAGLAIHDLGGDFADGLIAHEGSWLGGEVFMSFDKKAVALLARHGYQAKLVEA